MRQPGAQAVLTICAPTRNEARIYDNMMAHFPDDRHAAIAASYDFSSARTDLRYWRWDRRNPASHPFQISARGA
jgi:hypothetical protein